MLYVIRNRAFRIPKFRQIYERYFWRFRRNRRVPKIFIIGYFKTGTTSVGRALRILGYQHNDLQRFADQVLYSKGRENDLIQLTRKFDSFEDVPWSRIDIIPKLDEYFPGSKWIYTEREEKAWKQSWVRWNQKRGREVDAVEGWTQYKRHEEFVMTYFADRKEFLKLSVSDEEGFDKLAEFLGLPKPGIPFPKINVT